MLEQRQDDKTIHPIAYASRGLTPSETRYGISELEALAAVWALRKFRVYLLGYETIWYPDHAALTSLMNLKNPSGKLARWGMAVQEISLEIRYWPGRVNENADALSRAPVPSNEENLAGDEVEALMATPVLSVCKVPATGSGEKENVDEICEMHPDLGSEQNDDPVLREIIEFESSGKLPENESRARYLALSKGRFTLIDGMCHVDPRAPRRLQVVVPAKLRSTLLEEIHSGRLSGHFSEKAVLAILSRRYWWGEMRKDVRQFCRACLPCLARDGAGRRCKPELIPIPVGGPFERVGSTS